MELQLKAIEDEIQFHKDMAMTKALQQEARNEEPLRAGSRTVPVAIHLWGVRGFSVDVDNNGP